MQRVDYPLEQLSSGTVRRRRILHTAWAAATSLYLLIAIGASWVAYHKAVVPTSSLLARTHAEHVAEIAFESLYSLMREGVQREGLQRAAMELENTGNGIAITFVRGPLVVSQFGDLGDSRRLKTDDPLVMEAFRSRKIQVDERDRLSRIVYPAHFRSECLACHSEGQVGDLAGVVIVAYPTGSLLTSRRDAILPLIIYFAAGLPLVWLVTWLALGSVPGVTKNNGA